MPVKEINMIGPVMINGKSQSLSKWAKHYKVPFQTVYRRWHQGIRDANSLFAPPVYARSRGPAIDIGSFEAPVLTPSNNVVVHEPTFEYETPKQNVPDVEFGDWVCINQKGDLSLGLVVHVKDDSIFTSAGFCTRDQILEVRKCRSEHPTR